MVKSVLKPEHIIYNENRNIDADDINHATTVYTYKVFGKNIEIGLGNIKHTYSAHNVVYYSIYLIINDEMDSRIGVVEINSNDLVNSLDEDGDFEIEKGKIILFVDENEIQLLKQKSNEGEDSDDEDNIPRLVIGEDINMNDISQSDTEEESDSDNDSDDDMSIPKLVIGEDVSLDKGSIYQDNEDDATELKVSHENISNITKENNKQLSNGIFEKVENFEQPEMLLEETKEHADKIKENYKNNPQKNWVSRFMKNDNYEIIGIEGNGDCFFSVIRDGFAQVGKRTTVEKLRTMLSNEVTVELFEQYKNLYEGFYGMIKEIHATRTKIRNDIKMLKKQRELELNKPNSDKNKIDSIIEKANLLVDEYKEYGEEDKSTKKLLDEFKFMENIKNIDDLKEFIKTREYWADTWAVSTMERILNIKIIVLSQTSYIEKDYDSVMNCGQLNDDILASSSNGFKPDFYIMTSYTGNHYNLIEYKNKRIFKFTEVPYNIKSLIINKCLERNAGPYYLIDDFRNLKTKLGLDVNEGEPIIDEDEFMKRDLYDNNTVFMFHNQSNKKPAPGHGSGEKIKEGNTDFNELRKITDWRKKLDDSWEAQIKIDNHYWKTVQHYLLGSQFKKGFPDFYLKFSLDSSDSEIAKDLDLAKIAGGKEGKTKSTILREPSIVVDPDYYEVGVNPRHEEERYTALTAKFTQNLDLRDALVATKNAKLIHFNRGKEPNVDLLIMRVRKEI